MSGDNRMGPLVTAGTIRTALQAYLETWLSFHLAEAERAEGIAEGTMPRDPVFEMPVERAKWPESALPCVLIVVGAETNPRADGYGTVRYDFPVEFGAIVGGVDEADTRQQQSVWGAALRQFIATRLLATPGLEVEGASLPLGDYTPLPQERARSLQMAAFATTLTVSSVVADRAGVQEVPGDPLEDPGPYPAVIPPAHITIERED